MPAEAVKYIGDKLCVGPIDFSFLPAVPAIPGSAVLNGPVWIGAGGPPIPTANCMIGPGLHPITLQVTGIANFMTITNYFGIYNRSGPANVTGFTNKNGVDIKLAFSGTSGFSAKSASQTTAGPKMCYAKIVTPLFKSACYVGNVVATTGANSQFLAVLATKRSVGSKKFDIPHPTKEGWRLRYVCAEGPRADVEIKGTLKNNNIIKLPDYWRGLVHTEEIFVILTAIGSHQKLFYNISECGTEVIVSNDSGNQIHCDYIIIAERKDAERNIDEYEGETIHDYPGSPLGYQYWIEQNWVDHPHK